ncbi:MAG: XrtA-associated tyrosine autokinase [Pseudomonadota bacterium]
MSELGNTDARAAAPIKLASLAKAGMLTPESGRSSLAEDFRNIKRPLLRQAFAGGAARRNDNLIIVTSALPGEGKTYCAVNLAMSIAMERDVTVLLVDAHVARPSVLKVLGLEPAPGLMDILLGEQASLGDVILKTNVDALSILPSGRRHKNATELLASQAMSALLSEIAQRYPERIIIFDAPPLLLASEANVLAAQMGQVVMVVEAEKTSQDAVKEALARVSHCARVELIYNKARPFPGAHGYGSADD